LAHRQIERRSCVAKHDVGFEMPQRALERSDVIFRVREDGELLGTLTVSKGSVVWFPKKSHYGHKVGWSKFDALMREHVTRFEKRSPVRDVG
jgi:adenylate cyclase class IV